jgi:gamma-glutamyl-gamma-aminobutyrate hydrolase PuuD
MQPLRKFKASQVRSAGYNPATYDFGARGSSLSASGGVDAAQFVRIVIVSRRHLRKNKYVDFVGEYHIDLVQQYGAVPIIVPRTEPTRQQLDAYLAGGIDGVLVMEGSDLGSEYNPYGDMGNLPKQVAEEVRAKHAGDVEIDEAKDSLEMRLIKEKVLAEGVPYLGLCRGSQMLNVALGGTLYFDVCAETSTSIRHIDYDNYDGHRHPLSVLPNTPLAGWFHEQFEGLEPNENAQLSVNSYHHQGIRDLAKGMQPLCYDPDGLVEGFYDPRMYDPEKGKFLVGLQWHPERMLEDYPGCPRVYRDFVRAATVHRQLMNSRRGFEPQLPMKYWMAPRYGRRRSSRAQARN